MRCDALQYDSEGNLWMVNTEVDTILVVLKPDRTWTKLYYQELNMGTNFTHILFDSKGRLWTNSKRYEKGQGGFFALDYNGTLEDTSDDIHIKKKYHHQPRRRQVRTVVFQLHGARPQQSNMGGHE